MFCFFFGGFFFLQEGFSFFVFLFEGVCFFFFKVFFEEKMGMFLFFSKGFGLVQCQRSFVRCYQRVSFSQSGCFFFRRVDILFQKIFFYKGLIFSNGFEFFFFHMGFEFFHFSTRFVLVFKGVCFSIGFVYFYIKCVFLQKGFFFSREFVSFSARAFFFSKAVVFFSRRG